MNLYIPIEVKVRELESKVLLALAAAERGFDVLAGSKDDVLQPVVDGNVPAGIVHMKSVTPSDAMLEMLVKLRKRGCVVTALDEEAGIIDEDFTPFGRLRFSDESLDLIDTMFCWGEFDQDSLKSMFPRNAKKFIATGSPRVDLWKPEFNEFHLLKESGLTEKYGKFVLLSSNFGTILNENRIPNMIARMREAGYFDRDESRENHEYQNAAYQTQLVWEFVKLFRYLSKEFPDINFVIRPHPVESIESWKMLIGKYPNIHVVRQGSITPWVLNTSCVIHNGCTTGLEAAFFGKNVIAYRPLPSPIERVVPNNVSIQLSTHEEVATTLRKLLKSGKKPEQSLEVKSILQSRFENFEGMYAFDAIADEWKAIAQRADLPDSPISPKKIVQSVVETESPSVLLSLKRRIKGVLSKPVAEEVETQKQLLNTAHKFESLSDMEVLTMVESFKKATNTFKNVTVERFGLKSFRFYSGS